MAIQELTQDPSVDVPSVDVPSVDVQGSRSMVSWSVAECGWKQVLPDLPDDVIALLATPVVVTAVALTHAVASTKVVDRASPHACVTECTPHFLAPAAPSVLAPAAPRPTRARSRFA